MNHLKFGTFAFIGIAATQTVFAQDLAEAEGASQARYTAALREAVDHAAAGETPQALLKLQEAQEHNPDAARPHYLEGALQRTTGEAAASETSFRACMARAEGREDVLYGRCLVNVARVLEENRERWAEARALWLRYQQFAIAHPEASAPALAEARIEALDRIRQTQTVAEAVRERINAREQAQ